MDLAAIKKELAALQERLSRVESERDEYRKLYTLLREENERLKRGLLGQKAERAPKDDAQLSLAILELLDAGAGTPEPEPQTETIRYQRTKPTGRKPVPASLPVVEFEIIPDDVQQIGLENFDKIGEEVRDVIERRPASLVHVRIRRGKYAPKGRVRTEETEISIAEPAETPIPKGLAGPGLLADTLVRRWQDHLPLHRLESIYAREGLPLARSTIGAWHEQLLPLVRPVIEAMHADALRQPYLCTDATGVLVQAKDACRVGHYWVLVAPERHVLFRYSARHDGKAVDALLPGYAGYLVADAHSVYDHLYRGGDVVEVACWAHARRYFFKALETDPERARAALAMIAALFQIERGLVAAPRKKKREVRTEQSRPIVERFFRWCDEQALIVLDETPISKAIGYARNQRDALLRFLDEPMLPIHNNVSELQLRREVVGRKNWLFVGSDDAAEINAAFVSLLASCAMHRIEPWSYLRDLLCLLPGWPKSKALDLSPACWKQTLEQKDAQERLDADPFRAVTLDDPLPAFKRLDIDHRAKE